MNAVHQDPARLGLFIATLGRLACHVRAEFRSLRIAWFANRRRAAARREFARLDAVGLRDLGLCASEFDSCWSESTGAASVTRRRIADACAG
ncbi:hypothetical protein WG922_19595 [Ramlibacter sp. AN1015]|uniref:hypothetical protein n=1 Tax=Ramlibacter sp. AN1015 TaxID=3133428 RepID=UPI0030BC65FE